MSMLSKQVITLCRESAVKTIEDMYIGVAEGRFYGLAALVIRMDQAVLSLDFHTMKLLYYMYKSMDLPMVSCQNTAYMDEIKTWFKELNEEFDFES